MNSTDSLHQTLYRLESRPHQPEVRFSPAELMRLLADNFIEFGSSGRIYDRQAIIESLALESSIQISMDDIRISVLTPDIVLVTYRAKVIEPVGGPPQYSLRSSIWKQTEGVWQMIFHQGTPTKEFLS